MVKIAVTMETCDRSLRGGTNYLHKTLNNMSRAGVFDSPYLSSFHVQIGNARTETDYADGIAATSIVYEPATRQQNAQRAIYAGAMDLDADYVLKLEDDLDFCHDFLGSVGRFLERFGHSTVPMFVFGASFDLVSQSHFEAEHVCGLSGYNPMLGDTCPGCHLDTANVFNTSAAFPYVRHMMAQGHQIAAHNVLGWWAAQAVAWHRADALALAEWLGPDPFLDDGKEHHRMRGHDLLLQIWGSKEKNAKYFGCSIPSFVQHIGRESNLDQPAINHKQPFFQFPWGGPDWRFA
jgi:hypothetical protein